MAASILLRDTIWAPSRGEHKSIPGEPPAKRTRAAQSGNQPGTFAQQHLPSPPSRKGACNSPSVTFIKATPHQITDAKTSEKYCVSLICM